MRQSDKDTFISRFERLSVRAQAELLADLAVVHGQTYSGRIVDYGDSKRVERHAERAIAWLSETQVMASDHMRGSGR